MNANSEIRNPKADGIEGKIEKLLRLAGSCNEHEAALALAKVRGNDPRWQDAQAEVQRVKAIFTLPTDGRAGE